MKQVPDFRQLVVRGIQDSLDVKNTLLQDQEFHTLIVSVGHLMAEALRKGNRIFYFGNGGSAANAQHLSAELTGRYLRDRPGLPGIALTVNTSSITAIANDYYTRWFFCTGSCKRCQVKVMLLSESAQAAILQMF